MICSRVDFPQPDGPTIETKLPASISRSTPLSATVVPPAAAKLLCRPLTRRTVPPDWLMLRSGYKDALGEIDGRLQQTEFLHHRHRVVHFLEIDRGAQPRQQHLVLERRVEIGELLIDVARRRLVGRCELRTLGH